jgi:diguanylate cyclase (GGDEF)-like protein/PAS domain S-box-containing protein
MGIRIHPNEQSQEREIIYRLVSESSHDGIWYWDFVENKRFFLSDWYEIFGLSKDQSYDRLQWDEKIHPEDRPFMERQLREYLEEITEKYQCQYRIREKDGGYRWVEEKGKVIRDNNRRPALMAGAHIDISKYKSQQQIIDHMTFHDRLTDLPNRVLFMDRLNIALGFAKRHNNKTAVIFMDMDNFKTVNESRGHEWGDRVLQVITGRMTDMVRNYETIARLGGDEFAIVLAGIESREEVANFCERLRKNLAATTAPDGNWLDLSASMGVALYPDDGLTPAELLYNADIAMNNMKAREKNGWQFFQPQMKTEVTRKLEIKQRLRKAFENQEFTLHYQPQIDMKTGKIRAVEALIRWNEPMLGRIAPLEFIPIAEESGIIISLGEWVLREACRQNRAWRERYNLSLIMAVNISAIQLKQRKFVDVVIEILADTGVSPECLELEITESVFIHSFEEVASMLGLLRRAGVKISLDDFGIGYSSLSYLKRLPLDTLKIDKSFISDIHGDERGKNITDSIVNLVHKLGLITVAEGVETQKQLDCLLLAECDNVQGYLLGKPLPAAEVDTLLLKHDFRGQIQPVHPEGRAKRAVLTKTGETKLKKKQVRPIETK